MDENQNDLNEQPVKEQSVEGKKGFNITSMVLGILSVVFTCIWYVSLPCGIIAIIFGIAGKDRAGRKMGIAGLILGIIGVAFCILAMFGLLSFFNFVANNVNTVVTYY